MAAYISRQSSQGSYGSYNNRERFGDRKRDGKFSKDRPRRKPINRIPPSKDFKIDYKNFTGLVKFVNDRGKIAPHRITGFSSKDQRKLTEAIKRARFLGLLPSGSVKKI